MSSSTSRSTLKFAALTLSLIASVFGSSAAHASSPRLLARDVSGAYDMQDGSTVRIDVVGRRVLVESSAPAVGRRVLVESSAPEYWTTLNSNFLVSPDGLRRIRLRRDFSGRVDLIEMHITSAH